MTQQHQQFFELLRSPICVAYISLVLRINSSQQLPLSKQIYNFADKTHAFIGGKVIKHALRLPAKLFREVCRHIAIASFHSVGIIVLKEMSKVAFC